MTPYDLIKNQMSAAVPFAGHVGLTIEELDRGRGVTRLELTDQVKNHLSTMHAGALFSCGEAASGAAMAGTFADIIMEVRPVASGAKIDYARPAKGPVRAEAVVERSADELRAELDQEGKVSFVIKVSVTDESDREVASMTVDWHVKRAR